MKCARKSELRSSGGRSSGSESESEAGLTRVAQWQGPWKETEHLSGSNLGASPDLRHADLPLQGGAWQGR